MENEFTDRLAPELAAARRDLLDIFSAGVDRVGGEAAVRRWLEVAEPKGEHSAVAIGKAGAAMLRGATTVLGDSLRNALLICGPEYVDAPPARVIWKEGAHPVPDERSLAAGRTLLQFIASQPKERTLWFLISGGASSMVEVPQPGVDDITVSQVNAWLLGSGLPIYEMNRVRKALSQIKGGGLLNFLHGRHVKALLISDVPDDDLAVIGSGLLTLDDSARSDAMALDLPPWLGGIIKDLGDEKSLDGQSQVEQNLVATNRDARRAAANRASKLGYPVIMHETLLADDAGQAGERLAQAIIDGPPGIQVWGGETTMVLPPDPGRGGRCQHLSLSAARVMKGRTDVALLSAGTDGRDGPGGDAGAMVDGLTLWRGETEDLDVEHALAHASSGDFLEAAGDLIQTGPTGTNVMDLVIGWKGE